MSSINQSTCLGHHSHLLPLFAILSFLRPLWMCHPIPSDISRLTRSTSIAFTNTTITTAFFDHDASSTALLLLLAINLWLNFAGSRSLVAEITIPYKYNTTALVLVLAYFCALRYFYNSVMVDNVLHQMPNSCVTTDQSRGDAAPSTESRSEIATEALPYSLCYPCAWH